ncbi:MAG: glycosyltransferase family 4 protein, partial [bacterium]
YYLVSVINILMEQDPQITFELVGTGVSRAAVEKHFKPDKITRIRFFGNLSKEKMLEHYMENGILLVTSIFEGGCPLVMKEAMACGLVCVAFDIPVMHDLIENNKNGILVEPGNIRQMAGKITSLIKDPKSKRHISGEARKSVISVTWQKAADDLERVIQNG